MDEPERKRDSTAPGRGTSPTRERIVGLGGSAGSVQALQRFFARMPIDSGMAFVVILHLSPDHESVMSEVLQQVTTMPVSQARDGQAMERNHVYVIPPSKHLALLDGHLRVSDLPRQPGKRMVIDLFFRSLADTHGSDAIAIVLSGADGDGALGIKRIKERGGLTIAQDPTEAGQASMPRAAIATSMVDWVLRIDEMPERIVEYDARERRIQMPPEAGPYPTLPMPESSAGDEAVLREVLSFLRVRTGRDFSYYKRATILRRLARRMQVNEVETLLTYRNFLRTHPGEAGALLQDLLISVTNFFRDPEAFEALEAVVPDLFTGKSQQDSVRVWVPACATGEEAYSIAMLLSDHARTLTSPPAIQVFATDLDQDVLAEARIGAYPDAISEDISAERLRRYFVKQGSGYRVRRELREMLLFALHDVVKDSPFSRLDLISCRNLLIYLNRDAQLRVFDVFHFALRPGGRLLLGSSESVDEAKPLFSPTDKKHRLYAARAVPRNSSPLPSGPSALALAMTREERLEPAVTLPSATAFMPPPTTLPEPTQGRTSWSELHLKLIERFGPPSLLVNDAHDILHLSVSAGPFLQFAGGEPTSNLLRVVHPMLRTEVRAALYRAKQTGSLAVAAGLPVQLGEQQRVVDVRVSPSPELGVGLMLVTFELQAPGALELSRDQTQAPLIEQLEAELEQTKHYLQAIVKEHEASTEELKASNEELQAMNEELRSASEELETSREELQSINEELTTVNQELKSKVDELRHLNSDLRNLMGATAIATVFLDRDFRIMRFTPSAVELFNLIATDVGRPLADLQHKLQYPELMEDTARVLKELVPLEREVGEAGGRFFLARLLPYRTTDDHIAGVVLTFVDVTERHRAQDAIQRAQQELEQRVRERTAELDAANQALRLEIDQHQQAQIARQTLQGRLVNAQEQERGRISRELHDEVGQHISALMLSLKALESAGPSEEMPNRIRELRATTEQVGREIHQIASQLRPVALDELGLVGALSSYLSVWGGRTQIAVDFVSAGIEDARLPPSVESTLYRVIQEAMNNVYKHAAAKNVSVSVERREEHVLAIVEDDGQGFDAEAVIAADDHRHIGIPGMRERLAIVGGDLTVDSRPGGGATVRARIPLPAAPKSLG
ncbi:MAG: chemotaxis protein CheB [Polyangiaceae bacterium]